MRKEATTSASTSIIVRNEQAILITTTSGDRDAELPGQLRDAGTDRGRLPAAGVSLYCLN
jgi:hypothetical protein